MNILPSPAFSMELSGLQNMHHTEQRTVECIATRALAAALHLPLRETLTGAASYIITPLETSIHTFTRTSILGAKR